MKKIAAMICLLMSVGAIAQSTDVDKIDEGYQSLRAYPSMSLHEDMVDLYGKTTTPSSMDLAFGWDPTGQNRTAYIRANEYVKNTETVETTGDGSTLFSYNVPDRTYLAHDYANASGESAYKMDMLQRLYSISGRRGAYAARLLQEIFGGDNAAYSPWSSGEMTYVDAAYGPMQDPLTDATYTPSATQDFIAYESSGHISRSIVFQRNQITGSDNLPHWVISAVYVSKYDDLNPLMPNGFALAITIDPVETEPDPTQFTFVPPVQTEGEEGSAR